MCYSNSTFLVNLPSSSKELKNFLLLFWIVSTLVRVNKICFYIWSKFGHAFNHHNFSHVKCYLRSSFHIFSSFYHFLSWPLKEGYWEIPALIDKSGAVELVILLSDFFKHYRQLFSFCSLFNRRTDYCQQLVLFFCFIRNSLPGGKIIPDRKSVV